MGSLDFIQNSKQYISRKIYIKRRTLADVFETDWQRIDFENGIDVIINYGEINIDIDSDPGQIANFTVNAMVLKFDNSTGFFNKETDENSFWYGYLTRAYTKIKIESGFEPTGTGKFWGGFIWGDGTIWGVSYITTDFEGIIDTVKINTDETVDISIKSYNYILTKYYISDLSLTGNELASDLIETILNRSKITKYIAYNTPVLSIDPTIISDNLTGNYFDVLREICYYSNSVIYMNGATLEIKPRTPSVSSVYTFTKDDIIDLIDYDDEGKERVRLYWKSEGESRYAITADTTLRAKYLDDYQLINLDNIYTGTDKDLILATFLAAWEDEKPIIQFKTRYFLDYLKPLDKINIIYYGKVIPLDFKFWGGFVWGDSTIWAKEYGSIRIPYNSAWMITSIIKDLENYCFTIRAEKI